MKKIKKVKKTKNNIKFMAKIKKCFKKIGKKLCLIWKAIVESYNNLAPKAKKIVTLWGIILLVIILFVVFSAINGSRIRKYKAIEKNVDAAMLDYVKTNDLHGSKEDRIKIDINVLLDESYLYDEGITDNKCEGYSTSYYDNEEKEFVTESYINCKNYITIGFND